MSRRKEYILIFGITLMSWGIVFPQYTFTSDSYRLLYEEAMEPDAEDIQSAVRDGKVRYKLKIIEYLKDLFP